MYLGLFVETLNVKRVIRLRIEPITRLPWYERGQGQFVTLIVMLIKDLAKFDGRDASSFQQWSEHTTTIPRIYRSCVYRLMDGENQQTAGVPDVVSTAQGAQATAPSKIAEPDERDGGTAALWSRSHANIKRASNVPRFIAPSQPRPLYPFVYPYNQGSNSVGAQAQER